MLKRTIVEDAIVFSEGVQEFFRVEETESDSGIILTMKGMFRSDVVPDIQDELAALATVGAKVIVDLAGVQYLSSAAQHMFLITQQKMDELGKGLLVLRALPEALYQEFEETGAAELLMIE